MKTQRRSFPNAIVVIICGMTLLQTMVAEKPRTNCDQTTRNITFNANGTSKIFNSPSYPRPYPVNLNCTYLFATSKGNRIELTFSSFQLEGPSPRCDNDYIELRDGPDNSSPFINKFCGPDDPTTITSTTNFIRMEFVSNPQFFFQGFEGTYRVISEVEIAKCTNSERSATLFSKGYFTSPTFPAKYPPNRECSWSLEAPSGHFMRMTFHVFQTQCPDDKVIIRDGNPNGQLLGEFCGDKRPPEFRGRRLWVSFKSDDEFAEAERGFNVSYEALAFKGQISNHCIDAQNTILNSSVRGTIKSPWQPDNYPNNMDCTWFITAPDTKRVKLTFKSFDLQNNCDKDFVEIQDLTFTTRSRTYCGPSTIPDIVSSGSGLRVRFVSDSSERRSGFVIEYEAVSGGLRSQLHTFYSLLILTVLYLLLDEQLNK